MEKNILEIAMSKKGQFAALEWSRPCKTLKSCNDIITKRTTAHGVQLGVAYDNKAVVKEARESGDLPAENQGLRGKHWIKFPYVLQNDHNDTKYLRISTTANTEYKTQYFRNGQPVEKKDIENILYSSEKKPGEKQAVFDIKLDNITNIK